MNSEKNEVKKTSAEEREERILAYWTEHKIFEKSVERDALRGNFVFYDGPPFATGQPHFGHVLPTSIKDAVPRYKTMQGYRVRRRWGWDCHGLPVENLIEKELGLKSKKDIVNFGVKNFNAAARTAVHRYVADWKRIIPRLGRWADMENDYETMNASYTESVWWAFKQLHGKGLVYEGFKPMQICPHCETTLSNFEVAQGYKDIKDISVYVKFELTDESGTFFLAWTTTPWTLPGNVALAVGSNIDYVKVKIKSPINAPAQNDSSAATQDERKLFRSSEGGRKSVPVVVGGADQAFFILAKDKTTPLPAANLSRRVSEEGAEKASRREKVEDEFYILAKERLEATFKKEEYEIVETMKGSELVGRSYKPLFDYYSKDANLKNRENGWKVYAADFVTTTDGTGIVHIAPAFGADDYALGQMKNLPFVQHVGVDGAFKTEVKDFAGLSVKPKDTLEDKDAHLRSDIRVIQWLQDKSLLFAKENLTHSYPHCWRCDTPLLNYAASSWFVRVSSFKEKLVDANKKVSWTPSEVGEGRFGNWLSNARDWAISRSRFWGAPIPVWRVEYKSPPLPTANLSRRVSEEGGEKVSHREKVADDIVVIGSIAELKKYSQAKNTYYVMRHGEAENNTLSVMSAKATDPKHLTEKGKGQVKTSAAFFADKKIDLIYVSPFVRTRETADILASSLNFSKKNIIVDDRLHELNSGVYDGRPFSEFMEAFPHEKRFSMRLPGGENYTDVRKRMGDFIYAMEKKHSGKNILIVTHDAPAFVLSSMALGLDDRGTIEIRNDQLHYFDNAAPERLDFSPLPHNDSYELDLHRPYIDDVELRLPSGEKLKRVEEVFDCWFESGSMPFGEAHYPFETDAAREGNLSRRVDRGEKAESAFDPKEGFLGKITGGKLGKSRGYPADFIAEGLDQTRGWFYSMLVLGASLFGRSPYKNVVVNGIILAEDGQKMSKSKNNFPDLSPVLDKYGADALRYYLLSSPAVRAQEFCFSERGVDEVVKKHIGRLLNVVSFYELYGKRVKSLELKVESEFKGGEGRETASEGHLGARRRESETHREYAMTACPDEGVSLHETIGEQSPNILDQWILSRLNQLNSEVTEGMERYELDKATRPFADFIDDLSTWYLRRSRDRFKSEDEDDKTDALITTRFVLHELSKLLAPFMPFLAEDIYMRMKGGNESVHLEAWPTAGKIDANLLLNMKAVREIASLGLEARSKAKINVRQPLSKLKFKTQNAEIKNTDLLELIKEEVNVKEVVFDAVIATGVELDLNITPELKEEGELRDLMRAIQDRRKEQGLTIQDRPTLRIFVADKSERIFLEKNKEQLIKAVLLKDIEIVDKENGGKVEKQATVSSFELIV